MGQQIKFIADDQSRGMTAAELRAALEGVPDDYTPRVFTTFKRKIKEISIERGGARASDSH